MWSESNEKGQLMCTLFCKIKTHLRWTNFVLYKCSSRSIIIVSRWLFPQLNLWSFIFIIELCVLSLTCGFCFLPWKRDTNLFTFDLITAAIDSNQRKGEKHLARISPKIQYQSKRKACLAALHWLKWMDRMLSKEPQIGRPIFYATKKLLWE